MQVGCRVFAATVFAGVMGCIQPAFAKPADCYTSDDGNYPCDFRGTDRAGSFIVTAPGYPTVIVEVESAGIAWVLKNFGDRNVALPGPYNRARDDRACWANPNTGDRICAW